MDNESSLSSSAIWLFSALTASYFSLSMCTVFWRFSTSHLEASNLFFKESYFSVRIYQRTLFFLFFIFAFSSNLFFWKELLLHFVNIVLLWSVLAFFALLTSICFSFLSSFLFNCLFFFLLIPLLFFFFLEVFLRRNLI